jgi:hypothetical protein
MLGVEIEFGNDWILTDTSSYTPRNAKTPARTQGFLYVVPDTYFTFYTGHILYSFGIGGDHYALDGKYENGRKTKICV